MSEHATFDGELKGHERAWTLRAAEHEEAAEQARDRKHRELSMHLNAPDEVRRKLTMHHDAAIKQHETAGCSCRRRAEHAAAGYLLHGPSEGTDANYMKDHTKLIEAARRLGRLRQVSDTPE